MKMERDDDEDEDENIFHLVSYKWFRRTQYITSIGLKYNVCEILPVVICRRE